MINTRTICEVNLENFKIMYDFSKLVVSQL